MGLKCQTSTKRSGLCAASLADDVQRVAAADEAAQSLVQRAEIAANTCDVLEFSITRRLSTGLGLDYSAFAFAIYWQDTSISFPSEDAARAWGAGRQYLDLDFLRVTGLVPGAVPVWYRDGMAELLRAATMTPATQLR